MSHEMIPPQIRALLPDLVVVAQEAYDRWGQDEEGYDEELGTSGICQDIAEELAGVLNGHGIDASTVSAQVGEQHVWVVAKIDESAVDEDGDKEPGPYDGVWSIDIPPSVYERGGGYTWRKIRGVKFDSGHVVVTRESPDPSDFERYMED